MGLFSKFKGDKSASKTSKKEAIPYKGCEITPAPQKTAGAYRVGALIIRDKDGAKHQLVRSDVITSYDEAKKISELKAKMAIDQLGDGLF